MAKIALDIDSTLHHYWDLIDRISQERFGIELPYEDQTSWESRCSSATSWSPAWRRATGPRTSSPAEPYPGAVETVRPGARGPLDPRDEPPARSARATAPLAEWLERIGMPYDDLHCSFDKVTRCASSACTCLWTTAR